MGNKKNERCRRANVLAHTRIVDSDTIADDGERNEKDKRDVRRVPNAQPPAPSETKN